MIGIAGVVAAVAALGAGSAGLAAPKPHHPKPPHPAKPKPAKPKPTHVSCSTSALIAAINAANSNGGGRLELAGHCTYSLTSADNTGFAGSNGLPVVTSKIVTKGHDSTIAANKTDFRIFEVDGPNGNLTLDHVTLTGGAVPAADGPAGEGGALLDLGGTVTVKHSVVTQNSAGGGGGLAVAGIPDGPAGSMRVDHSLISSNTATQGGGGLLNHGSNLTVTHSRITNNSGPGGGGIATGPGDNSGTGSVTVVDHTKIDHNIANSTNPHMGGGAGIANGGTLTVRHSELTDNTAVPANGLAGGGLLNHAVATLDHTKVKGNTAAVGGGLANGAFPPGSPAPQRGSPRSCFTCSWCCLWSR